MAHTPGPWPKDYVSAAVRHIARNCDFIESETNPEFGWDRYSGDADLIASAPDLARLLEKAVRAEHQETYMAWDESQRPDWCKEAEALLVKIGVKP